VKSKVLVKNFSAKTSASAEHSAASGPIAPRICSGYQRPAYRDWSCRSAVTLKINGFIAYLVFHAWWIDNVIIPLRWGAAIGFS
jgi:hypothetical protein